MAFEIILPGALSTVQDMGRTGFLSQGFQESGACDKYSMKLANLLAGNLEEPEEAAAVEFTLNGGEIRFTSDEVIALAGADMKPSLNGQTIPMYCPVPVKEGDILALGFAERGLRTYMALYGGVSVPVVMGSRSTNLKCRLGGLEGRSLRVGDVLESGKSREQILYLKERLNGKENAWTAAAAEPWLRLSSNPYRYYGSERYVLLRAVPGPQDEAFTPNGHGTFTRTPYRLSGDCDRMACRLEGDPIEMKNGADIISDGIVEGSVQVSASGQPMVLMADHQTAGGYAKIATVIRTDVPALAQLRPGDWVTFRYVTPDEAVLACRKEEKKLITVKERMEKAIGVLPQN
ncbi:biotin-dependent carboxyltransferase family protein [Lachnospiraceae bacterium 54-53]